MCRFSFQVSSAVFVVIVVQLLAVSVSAEPVKLAERTPVPLRLLDEMRSGKTPKGSTVRMEVGQDVKGLGDVVLIAKGSNALGTVTVSKRRGMFGRNGKLEFTVDSATAVDGTQVPLRATLENSGKSNKGTVIASALLLTVLAVFVNGRDITLKPGTEVTAYVDQELLIDPAKSAGATSSAAASAAPAISVTPTDIDRLAEALDKRISGSQYKDSISRTQIVVLPFGGGEGVPSSVCANIPEDMSMSLINLGYKVVDQTRTRSLLDSLKVQDGKTVDQTIITKVGIDTSSGYAVVGDVTDRGGVLAITARFVETSTGNTLLSDHIEIPATPAGSPAAISQPVTAKTP